MDSFATAKATTYGGHWSGCVGQRAHNSHATHHVDHKRNISSCGVKLLRLNSTGEISSDDKCQKLSTPTGVFTSQRQESAPGKIMGYLNNWMPSAGKHVDLNQSQVQYSASNSGHLSTLVNVFSSHQKDVMGQKNNSVPCFANDGTKSNIVSKVMDIFPSQSLVLNSFNKYILKTSYKQKVDMSSPWSKFYAKWKASNDPAFTLGWKNKENVSTDNNQSKPLLSNLMEENTLLETALENRVPKLQMTDQTESYDRDIIMKSGCSNKTLPISNMEEDKVCPGRIESSSVSVDPMFTIPCTEHRTVQKDKTVKTDNALNNAHSCDNSVNKTNMGKMSGILNEGVESSACNSDATNDNWTLCLDSDRCSKKSKRNKMSAKRQRRLKARRRQNCSTFSPTTKTNSDCSDDKVTSSETAQNETPNSTSPDNGQQSAANPVSFILGISELDNASSHKAYKVSMVVDCEESLFSEDEFDGDSDSFDFSLYTCDFLPHGGDLFNPLNFTVSISMAPSTPESNVPLSPLFQTNSRLDDINECWKTPISSPQCKSKSSKKVTFAQDRNLVVIHPMIAWDYAYRTARKGPWEEYARDRQRFQRRVEETEVLLSPILHPNNQLKAVQHLTVKC